MSRDRAYLLIEVSSERCRIEVALAGTSILGDLYMEYRKSKRPYLSVRLFL